MKVSKTFRITRAAMQALKYLAVWLFGAFIVVVVSYIVIVNNRADLSVWHVVELDQEYSADSEVNTFAEYLALEKRLFEQLDTLVYDEVPAGPENTINRYSRGSLSDPSSLPSNWNRTFELTHAEPRAGVLLLHGLSDSPYSMRALAQRLHAQGANVVGLRIPGHGTAPSGLVDVRWQDMAAAVRLAAKHVQESIGDKPFYMIGYSNGGALAIEYTLSMIEDQSESPLAGVILLAPEIGLSGSAAFAVWQGRLGRILGMDKLAWVSVTPEYDPYKYGSFAVNAGDLAHRITVQIQEQLDALQNTDKLDELPPILAFQSSVDDTVTASALVENLFSRLPAAGHELVLFDVNRRVEASFLLKNDPRSVFDPLLKDQERNFDLTVVANESNEGSSVAAYTRPYDTRAPSMLTLANDWPKGVYSLSHVALPFPPDDPIYGGPEVADGPGLQIGNLAFRGERGVLHVSATELMRLRWNPFFDYMEERVLQFTGLAEWPHDETKKAVLALPSPALDEIGGATVAGLFDEPIKLSGGRWENDARASAGIAGDFVLSGDLNGDEVDEVVALLWTSNGGSGTRIFVAVFGRDGPAVTNIATASLGDRVRLQRARIEDRTIILDVVQHSPDDAMCCPGDTATRRWVLQGDHLDEEAIQMNGRLSQE